MSGNPYYYNAASTAGATSLSIAYNSSVTWTAGDVMVTCWWTASGTVTGVSDGASNSYVPVYQGANLAVWVSTGQTTPLTTGQTIKATFSASVAGNALAAGVPGAAYAGVDVVVSNSGNSSSALASATGLVSGDTALAFVGSTSGNVSGWSGGFTALASSSHGSSTGYLTGAWRQNAQGTYAFSTAGAIASGAWTSVIVTLLMTNFVGSANAPSPVIQKAGTIAASADMNANANTALFNIRPPMIIANASASSGQSFTAGTAAPINWATLERDTDGFWSPTALSRLTVQTPGFYKIRWSIPYNAAGSNLGVYAQVTTYTNNPLGSGLTYACWFSWCGAQTGVNPANSGGGIIPVELWPGDYVQLYGTMGAASTLLTSTTPRVSMRQVSS